MLFNVDVADLVKKEKADIEEEIENLQPLVLEEQGIRIKFEVKLSMVDGKIISFITDTASNRRCNLCGDLPKEYKGKKEFIFTSLSLEAIDNISCAILHYGINSFNHLFNLACRLRIGATKGWNITKINRAKYDEAARYFQSQFLEKLNVRVGFPNPHGGSSTTGNVVSLNSFQLSIIS